VSKAFTRESDDAPDAPVVRRGVPVPVDVPNYVTADGARALRAELDTLSHGARDPDVLARIHELTEHLETAQVVEPADGDRVAFGATVTVADDDGGARTDYRIVGAIESSPRQGAISWQSPLARALLGARVGDTVALPRDRTAEVVAIRFSR
jgi:transcription elongation factor GreB